jgi:hypothetical protein
MDESEPAAAPKQRRGHAAGVAIPEEPAADGRSAPTVVEDGASLATDRVDVRMSALGRVDADQVSVGNGAVGAVRADVLSVDRGIVGAAFADTVEVSQGYARSIIGRQVQLDRAAARLVIAADVQARQSVVMVLIARRVDGDVRVLLDWRGALAFGAAAGLVIGLLSRLRRRR